jgi:hypothetical protein
MSRRKGILKSLGQSSCGELSGLVSRLKVPLLLIIKSHTILITISVDASRRQGATIEGVIPDINSPYSFISITMYLMLAEELSSMMPCVIACFDT